MHLLTFLSFVHWWSKNWTVDFCIKFLCWNSPCVLQAVVQAFTFIPTAMQSNFWVHFSQVLFVWCDFFGLVGLVYQAWKNVLCEWSKSRKRCYVNTAGETKTSGTEISLWVAVLSNLSHQKTKQMGDSVCCYPPHQIDMLIFFHSLCNWIQRQPWRQQLLLQLHRIWWIPCPVSTLNSAWGSTKP